MMCCGSGALYVSRIGLPEGTTVGILYDLNTRKVIHVIIRGNPFLHDCSQEAQALATTTSIVENVVSEGHRRNSDHNASVRTPITRQQCEIHTVPPELKQLCDWI